MFHVEQPECLNNTMSLYSVLATPEMKQRMPQQH
jgi:hypothetical protein